MIGRMFRKISDLTNAYVKRAQANRGSVKTLTADIKPRVVDYDAYIKLVVAELAHLDEECMKHTRAIKTICTRAEGLIRLLESKLVTKK